MAQGTRTKEVKMLPLMHGDAFAGTLEMVCYFFTVGAALLGCLFATRC